MQSIKNAAVILASSAIWRSQILTQLGISHQAVAHCYEEPPFSGGNLHEFVELLAIEKGRSLQYKYPDTIIISADQLIGIEGEVLGKPGSEKAAVQQLVKLNGKTHELVCAVAVLQGEKIEVASEKAVLTMRTLELEELQNYVRRDESWDCAGAYKIESLGASLFSKIETTDPNTIIGIPSVQLLNLLRKMGYSNLL